MKKEIWKDIKDYEGWYQISSYGRVRSVERIVYYSNNKIYLCKSRIRKPKKDRYGYLVLNLYKNQKAKSFTVHRLVAQAFIPNPNNLPEINHKDENKVNNCVFVNNDGSVDLNKSNLEWCTCQYNLAYGTRLKRVVEKRSRPVLQIDKEKDVIISEYPSAKEAGRQLNISQGHISDCCRGKRKTAGGFKWKCKKE